MRTCICLKIWLNCCLVFSSFLPSFLLSFNLIHSFYFQGWTKSEMWAVIQAWNQAIHKNHEINAFKGLLIDRNKKLTSGNNKHLFLWVFLCCWTTVYEFKCDHQQLLFIFLEWTAANSVRHSYPLETNKEQSIAFRSTGLINSRMQLKGSTESTASAPWLTNYKSDQA